MAVEHLTDSILQDYLDGNLGDKKSEIADHLNSCSLCRTRMEQYRLLYNELEVDSIPGLSPDFSKAVMSRIAQVDVVTYAAEDKKRPLTVPIPVYGIIGAIAAIASIIYFVNLEPLIRAFRGAPFSDYFNRILISKISSAASNLNFDFSLVLMVIATLIVIGGVDYIILHYKHRTTSFLV
ncbi:MAG TPA: hypothetical protein ENL22_04170 [candidate division Zixibacteria bacterium]|nr:hypothetical protein [candidate division Zixibacteria bacterium]